MALSLFEGLLHRACLRRVLLHRAWFGSVLVGLLEGYRTGLQHALLAAPLQQRSFTLRQPAESTRASKYPPANPALIAACRLC